MVCTMLKSKPFKSLMISYPRTGSHWLRTLMSQYFNLPFLETRNNKWFQHLHDKDGEVISSVVLYLYRNPIDVVFSKAYMNNKFPLEDINVLTRTDWYINHLEKWLDYETFTKKKTIIYYDELRRNFVNEFKKVVLHFSTDYDKSKALFVRDLVTKRFVKKRIRTNSQLPIITISDKYEVFRKEFREEYGKIIWSLVLKNKKLHKYFLKE